MVKDEMVIVGDYGYMFKELNLESEPDWRWLPWSGG